MAWIEQTKKGSRASGGPQYYLQDLSDNTKEFLRNVQRRPVRLWTPYGVIDSGLIAVSGTVGKVGHDRIQSGRQVPSIADQIGNWYALKSSEIESIEFIDSFDHDSFLIRPTRVKYFRRKARLGLLHDPLPLTFIEGHRSQLLVRHIRKLDKSTRDCVLKQIAALVKEHETAGGDLDERDLLRASGALDKMGIHLGMYRRIGIDCPDARFELLSFPSYPCAVEVEERSSGFLAAHHELHQSQRLVVLCMFHDAPQVHRGYVDIIEIRELCRFLKDEK
jgi:hypothetical protein